MRFFAIFKNVFKIIAVFVIGMVGGIFANQIFWPYFIERPFFYEYKLEQRPVYLTEKKEVYIQENVALKNAVEKSEKAVIGIRTKTGTGKILEGSGIILTSDGLIITLAELVPLGSEFGFYVDGNKASFQILKRDLEKNLALVKLEKTNLSTAGFANPERLKLGERVFLIGTVFVKEETKKSVNEGIVTSFDKDLIETSIFEKSVLTGSCLFDIEGRILGINAISKDGRVFTVPISIIRNFSGL